MFLLVYHGLLSLIRFEKGLWRKAQKIQHQHQCFGGVLWSIDID
jgi:hypothetical protein